MIPQNNRDTQLLLKSELADRKKKKKQSEIKATLVISTEV